MKARCKFHGRDNATLKALTPGFREYNKVNIGL